ncbi:MAG TPA: hypothetical protein VGU63_04105 [Candidatus Acidoferrales bacterium]|nr:hypothetical protein [Candidatus Acidoferrales bacterium]
MIEEPVDATPEEIALEEAIQRFEAETLFRQSNVLPMDAAFNMGRFYGLLLRASRPRNGIERVGFLFMGIEWVSSATVPSPLSVLFSLAGLKLIWTACRRAEHPRAEIA